MELATDTSGRIVELWDSSTLAIVVLRLLSHTLSLAPCANDCQESTRLGTLALPL